MKLRPTCPGCGNGTFSGIFELPQQPVVLNYRFADAEAASLVPRRDVTLVQCERCGLVFNATFDISAIPYDQNYVNSQTFSPAFIEHLEKLAGDFVSNNHLRNGRILEVGCGKGDFLRLLCNVADATGEGYDTSYVPGLAPESPSVKFHCRYVGPADITQPFDAIVCRHVVEHVPEIGEFLRELHAIAVAAGDPVVLLETPAFEWIVEQVSIWDVFFEHCNYFPMPSLAYLCRLAGFEVVRQRAVFESQYQILELKVARSTVAPEPPGIPKNARLTDFAEHASQRLEAIVERIKTEGEGGAWALWGAGAKGVSLANQLRGVKPAFVIDSNPAKQGGSIPGTNIPIVSPEGACLDEIGLVLIMNPNYFAEISEVLKKRDYSRRLCTL